MSGHQSVSFTARAAFRRAGPLDRTALVLATWFGCGLAPFAPGTVGTLGALPLVLLLQAAGWAWGGAGLVVLICVACWSADRAAVLLGSRDPGQVVIDEVAGLALTVYGLTLSWPVAVAAFLLFRCFDILKPFPLRRLEALPGGLGVVMDDLAAGVYARLALLGLLALQGWFSR